MNRHLLKLAALAAAITLWFYILGSATLEAERQVELAFVPPPGMAINGPTPSSATIRLRGNRVAVAHLFPPGEKISIDLNAAAEEGGQLEVELGQANIPLPAGVEMLHVSPDKVSLSLEREIKKWVPVKLKVEGELPEGLKLLEGQIVPAEVMIRGPLSVLRGIGQLSTAVIDLSTLSAQEGEGVLKTALEKVDARVALEGVREVQFKYKIRPDKANVSLPNVDILFLTLRNRFYSRAKRATLEVLVSEETLQILGGPEGLRGQSRVIAEIPPTAVGHVQVELRAEIPEGVHLLHIHPARISVSVR